MSVYSISSINVKDWDAYAEYMKNPDYSSGLDLFKSKDNVFILRTFSKIFGLSSMLIMASIDGHPTLKIQSGRSPIFLRRSQASWFAAKW